MRILFQLRVVAAVLLLGIAGGCRPASKPHEEGHEPAPDPVDSPTEIFQGVLKLSPWPTLLAMEAGDNGELSEMPIGLVSRDWKALELNADLRGLNDKLVELQGTPVFSGPARVIQVEPGSIMELEGSMGTPGRAAESRPVTLEAVTLHGRLFTLPFLARNGPKLPSPDDETAYHVQLEEVGAGLPIVLLLSKEDRPAQFQSSIIFVADKNHGRMLLAVNRPVTLHGTPEVLGSWQVLRVHEEPEPKAPAAQP